MKDWSDDHPKAKLMARKRAAILDAARDAFLSLGYEGASMEGIAAAAGVSIMTLYRHAEGKEDLFAAVISNVCDHSDAAKQTEIAAIMQKPLEEVLVLAGVMFQEKLAAKQTVLLFRTVMAETSRFPELSETAYRALVRTHESEIEALLAQKHDAKNISAAKRRKLSTTFISQLVGSDILRVLLGLKGASAPERRKRAKAASDNLLAELEHTSYRV